MSRTLNTIRNLLFGYLEEFIIVVLSFVNRRVFVQSLGAQFNGLNSVTSNILGMLNLVELGFGSAIIYNLYKPLVEKDDGHIKALMDYYKKVYVIIGLIISSIGLCIMPFLPSLIKDDLSFTNIYVVFGLQLLQTASTYLFFAYKKSILEADQKTYMVSRIRCVFVILQYTAQIIVLKIFSDYIVYLTIVLLSNVILNISIAIRADKEFPFLRSKSKNILPLEEVRLIKNNCAALFIYKINSAVLNATDSLILSKFVGLTIVGFYGHYLTLIAALKTVLNKIFVAMTGSLGNLHAESLVSEDIENNLKHEESVFRIVCMLSFLAFGLGSIVIFGVSSVFIDLWIGPGQTLNNSSVLLISIELFLYSFTKPTSSFRASMGLFQQAKYRPIASMVLNLIISIGLVFKYDVTGVLIGTVVSVMLTSFWFDPVVLYKHGFHASAKPYFFRTVIYSIVELLSIVGISFFKWVVSLSGFLGVIIYSVFSVALFLIVSLCFLKMFPEFNDVKRIMINVTKRIHSLFHKTA